jgi:ribosomal protein L10
MIYYIKDKNTILIRDIDDLPRDQNHDIRNHTEYYVNNIKFADITRTPVDKKTIKDMEDIIDTFFKNSTVQIFTNSDQFLAFLIYISTDIS